MRVQILGDLHLEFEPITLPAADADVVVLAGDIAPGRDGLEWSRQAFPGKPVVYVLGNHEFYRHSLPDLTESMQLDTVGGPIHVLENTAVELCGFTFLGCTLWTDFELSGDRQTAMRAAEGIMSDYVVIKYNRYERLLRATDTIALHNRSIAWLKEQLARCDPGKTVVVTHHAPSVRSEPPFHEKSQLSAAFASALDSLVESSRVPLWIHGHTHYNVDYRIGQARVLTNQRGYPLERCRGFNPGLVVTL